MNRTPTWRPAHGLTSRLHHSLIFAAVLVAHLRSAEATQQCTDNKEGLVDAVSTMQVTVENFLGDAWRMEVFDDSEPLIAGWQLGKNSTDRSTASSEAGILPSALLGRWKAHLVTPDRILTSVLTGVFVLFILSSLVDLNSSRLVLQDMMAEGSSSSKEATAQEAGGEHQATAAPEEEEEEAKGGGKSPSAPEPWSLMAIIGLTIYRFYTGFLSATWLPYLLAMEGAELWRDNQALFMGIAKLIYGVSILLTPLLGLLGDHIALKSHALGRRLFMRLGIIVAAVGIFMCHWASRDKHFWVFAIGVLIWRIGEGLNDVSIEAICPEILPPEQFEISSSIKAMMFLVGGLVGYVLVAAFAHVHYSWLYHGYLIMMFVCGVPALLLVRQDMPKVKSRSANLSSQPFLASCVDAYLRPARFPGGFPLACLCIFLFSCGSAPMFFLLLMLRDLVGIEEHIRLQQHFSLISIDFFLSAALAAGLNALAAPSRKIQQEKRENGFVEIRAESFRMTAASVMAFGVSVFLMPYVKWFTTETGRVDSFYIISGLVGATFGSVYARFQDCSWQLLPPGVEIANAMGFSTMLKLLGAGLGNFIAGLILDLFQDHTDVVPPGGEKTTLIHYAPAGYIVVCTASAMLAISSGVLILRSLSSGLEMNNGAPAAEATP